MKITSTAVLALTALAVASTSSVSAFAPIGGRGLQQQQQQHAVFGVVLRKHPNRLFAMSNDDDDGYEDDDDDYADDNEPLSKGIDSVSWLPTVVGAAKGGNDSNNTNDDDATTILPLFPLGGIVYTPNSEHVLNIFEPRYRQMYTDILMNGTKRFVVAMSHPSEQGRFAQTGVLFELEDLKEVSEQTGDQIKYICNHKVTGRVELYRVLNPEAWEARDTYLTVEGRIMDDTGKSSSKKEDAEIASDEPGMSNDAYAAFAAAIGKGLTSFEKDLKSSFASLVEIQHDLEEDVRFTKASVGALAVSDGAGDDGLWQTIRLWQAYADQRLVARQNELQKDFQDKLQEFLKKEKGMEEEELPSAISFQDLSPALQQEVQDLQKRMAVELEPLILESTLTMQKILEAADHEARCDLVRFFMDAERKRLKAKKTLLGMFGSDDSSKDKLNAEWKKDEKKVDDTPAEVPEATDDESTSMFDDPDAFQ